jgi:hypothetical protein
MKNMLLITALLLTSTFSRATTEVIDLKEALQQKMVSCTFRGNGASTHYLKPFKLKIKNLKNKDIIVRIPNGFTFMAEDSSYQNLIITEERRLALTPLTTKAYDLYAMCIEEHDRAPDDSVKYKPWKMANKVLAGLTKLIQEKKLYNCTAQQAVWVLACNAPIEDVAGNPDEGSAELLKYIFDATGKKLPPPPVYNDDPDKPESYHQTKYSLEISGFFEFDFPETSAVHVAMFDANGMVVHELYKNNKVPKGYHKIDFTFDATVDTADLYYIKMIANGEVMMSKKLQREK